MNTELTFRSHTFTPAIRDNKFWLTSSQIAEALEYSSTKSITNLYNQNEDEFTSEMTQVTESVTSGNYRKKVRIFSLRGAHLIAMFARTPVAKEFRRWVLDILDREVGETVSHPITSPSTYDSRTLCYKRNGVTINEIPLRDEELVITLESWVQLAQSNGWIVMRQEELIGKLVRGIERSLITH
ncbi:BRO-N domain-containing protein [Enterobacter hormaechei]|uniref:BRO-N domain-containing protein n=1 Tax=Enterobacter hormaechei TaxID=158836 RepID=UPI00125B1961|nr:BRO family protein [Enterobacter hormaechei]VAG29307.1 BRO family, N-terminal domain [Enterobacter hormaechei]VAM33670.1 BRO family, N-terminal domain [Enterobacter hormaechei]